MTICPANLLERYSRQMLLPEIGVSGQLNISSSKVAVVGAGGIGSTVLMYLAAAGVGTLTIIDFDHVELSNLHRQVLYDDPIAHSGTYKAMAAAQRLSLLNPDIRIVPITERLTHDNCMRFLLGHDVVIDASDNYPTRFMLSDACVLLGLPLVSGAAVGLEGRVTILCGRKGEQESTPCYRCLHPCPSAPSRSCSDAGVLGPVPGLVGCLQAVEALKLLVHMHGKHDGDISHKRSSNGAFVPLVAFSNSTSTGSRLRPLTNRQTVYDATSGSFHQFELGGRDPKCAACGEIAYRTITGMEASRVNVQGMMDRWTCTAGGKSVSLPAHATMTAERYYKEVLAAGQEHVVLDVRVKEQIDMISLRHYLRPSRQDDPCKLSQALASDDEINFKSSSCYVQLDRETNQSADNSGYAEGSDSKRLRHDTYARINVDDSDKQSALTTESTAYLPLLRSRVGELVAKGRLLHMPLATLLSLTTDEARRAVTVYPTDGAATSITEVPTHNEYARADGGNASDGVAALIAPPSILPLPVYVYCRRGVASVQAVAHLMQLGCSESENLGEDPGIVPSQSRTPSANELTVVNIAGGLDAWRAQVDTSFPKY